MTSKAQFNADEWARVGAGPFVSGLLVIAADRGGTVRETVELARAIADEQQDAEQPELIRELLAERPNPQELLGEGGEKPNPEELANRVEQVLGEAIGLLEQKATPEELEAYRRVCLDIGQRVAERTKSGGVLGIGGERVSSEEQAALERLRGALGA